MAAALQELPSLSPRSYALVAVKPRKAKKGAAKPGKKLPPVEAKQPLTQTEDILNSILPPRCAAVPLARRASERRCGACSP